ncbi:MAG: hypothetical protein NXH70_02115 [Hyphomonas sp.]|nr:hypothetical protein [Hyphomonas sp.]
MASVVIIDRDAEGNEQEHAVVEVPAGLETLEDFEAWLDRTLFAED